MRGVWDVDWLNSNSQRAYPLSEDVSRADVTGSFRIPDELIVDLIWPAHASAGIDPSKFHVKSIGIFGSGVTIALGYDGQTIGSVSIDAATHVLNTAYFISGSGDFYDTIGKIVIGKLEAARKSSGSFQFDLANARLVPTVIRPDIRGVTSVRLKTGEDLSDPIQGDVVLQAGTNFEITFVAGSPGRIVFSAIDGRGLTKACDCSENQDLPCIQTINGLPPDGNGNFTLEGDDCLKFEQLTNGLQLFDECSKPCCGCGELKVLEDTLRMMQNQVYSLENLGSRLEAQTTALAAGLLPRTSE